MYKLPQELVELSVDDHFGRQVWCRINNAQISAQMQKTHQFYYKIHHINHEFVRQMMVNGRENPFAKAEFRR